MNFEDQNNTTVAENVKRMQKALEGQPQWIYPKIFLKTPSSAFSFPDYPGLSVALKYYIIVGKIGWWITSFLLGLILAFSIYLLLFGTFFSITNFDLGGLFTCFLAVALCLTFIFLCLLISNLFLALQFASCELITVFMKMEGHLAYISGRQRKARQNTK